MLAIPNFWIGFTVGAMAILLIAYIAYLGLKWAIGDIPGKHIVSCEYDEYLPKAFD